MGELSMALTAAGRALKAKIDLGEGKTPLRITRVVAGDGWSGDPLALGALPGERQEFAILRRTADGGRATLACRLANYGHPEPGSPPLAQGYLMSQTGIYADDPDEGEVLYCVEQRDPPLHVPAGEERGWAFEPSFTFETGNASGVTVRVDPPGRAARPKYEASCATEAGEPLKAVEADPPHYSPEDGDELVVYFEHGNSGGAGQMGLLVNGDAKGPLKAVFDAGRGDMPFAARSCLTGRALLGGGARAFRVEAVSGPTPEGIGAAGAAHTHAPGDVGAAFGGIWCGAAVWEGDGLAIMPEPGSIGAVEDGMRFSFWSPARSDAPVITVALPSPVSAPLVQGDGVTPEAVAPGIVAAVYYDKCFFLASGKPAAEFGTAGAAQVLSGYTVAAEGGPVAGAMPDNGAVSQTLSADGASYAVPEGYHNGAGKVKAGITNLTAANVRQGATVGGVAGAFTGDADAAAADIRDGKTAYAKGEKLTGSMPAGVDTDDADAVASNILSGKTAYAKGAKLTGSMTNQGAVSRTLSTDMSSYTVPAGYHSGSGKVTANITSLVAANVKAGATVGGVSGTFSNDATAAAADIYKDMTAYAKGAKLTGTMVGRGAVSQTLSTNGASYTVPSGYHNGSGKVTASITNLTAANVKQGATVGGVAGNYTNDATAAASDILNGKIAYAKGAKLTGTFYDACKKTTSDVYVSLENGYTVIRIPRAAAPAYSKIRMVVMCDNKSNFLESTAIILCRVGTSFVYLDRAPGDVSAFGHVGTATVSSESLFWIFTGPSKAVAVVKTYASAEVIAEV